MSRLIIIQGPPASGKTTYARQQVAGLDNAVIISKDDIRHMMGDYWVPRREQFVDEIEYEMIYRALMKQYDVFCDGMNLEKSRIAGLEDLARKCEALVEFKQLYVPYRLAIKRDAQPDRQHHVGESNIRKIYEKFYAEEYAAEQLLPDEPEEEIAEAAIEPRLIQTQEGTIWNPTQSDLEAVQKLSTLRYSINKIAIFLGVPNGEFRRLLAITEGPLAQAYYSGKIQSELAYREKVRQLAERGEEWAIKYIEHWSMEQTKQELGF